VSQPPRADETTTQPNANAAYLAALGLMGSDGASTATGPQPVPLPSEGGPLGGAPANARVLGYPEGQGDYGVTTPRH